MKPRDPEDRILSEDQAQKFRKEMYRKTCHCGKDISQDPISYYVPHPDGWTIEGEAEKVWLFIHCSKCGYDMSIWKLGVSREEL